MIYRFNRRMEKNRQEIRRRQNEVLNAVWALDAYRKGAVTDEERVELKGFLLREKSLSISGFGQQRSLDPEEYKAITGQSL